MISLSNASERSQAVGCVKYPTVILGEIMLIRIVIKLNKEYNSVGIYIMFSRFERRYDLG